MFHLLPICTYSYSLASNFTIQGSGSGVTTFTVYNDIMTVAGHNRCFAFEANGTFYTATTLTGNVARDAANVTVSSTSELAAGNYIMITSTELWESELAGATTKSEVNRIVLVSGSTLVLEKRTRDSYATADTASVRRVDFLTNIHLKGFTIKAASDFNRNDVTFMRFDWCDNRTIEDVELVNFRGNFHKALVDNVIINSSAGPMRFYLTPELGHLTESGPYAISCRAACENIRYHHCNFHGEIRHCFTTTTNSETAKGGIPRNIHIEDCNADTSAEASFETHGEGDGDILFAVFCTLV
jgi:hypothetical protein